MLEAAKTGERVERGSGAVGVHALFQAGSESGERVLVLPDEAGPPVRTLASILAGTIQEPEASVLTVPVVRALGRLAETALEASGGSAPLDEVLARAERELPGALDASEAGAREAAAEAARLRSRIGGPGEAVLLDARAPVRIAARLARDARRPERRRLLAEIGALAEAIAERLRADDSLAPGASSPDRLAAGLGAAGAHVDFEALARTLPPARGPRPLSPERRARLEETRARLTRALETIPAEPDVVAAVSRDGGAEPDGVERVRPFDAPLEKAAALFDELAEERVDAVRAMRAARVDLEPAEDSDTRLAAIERLDWQGLDRDEIALLPAVFVVERGARVRDEQLGALSKFLRSGRPVLAVLGETIDDLHRDESWDAIAGFHPGLGYLAVAHREAFVLQASAARPEHLGHGLAAATVSVAPGVVLVTVPREGAPDGDRTALEAALHGRATPLLRYDPSAGETWAERFDLGGNPEPGAAWPVLETASFAAPWTFAHFAASEPGLRGRVLAGPAADEDPRRIPLAEWLRMPEGERGRRVPTLSLPGEGGEGTSFVVTRAAAFACLDRLRAWRILQELAGFDNEHARRAVEGVRREAAREVEDARSRLEAEHAESLERVRREAATQTVDRIVAALLGTGPLPAVPAPPAVEAVPPAAAEEEAEAETEAEVEISDEPWIDTPLCTTCNECTNLNGRMFRYDANKQATLADPSAGTYEDLVRAAEKCPARCIHPGAPTPGDPTANDELRARAAKFR